MQLYETLDGSVVKNSPAKAKTTGDTCLIPGLEDPLEKGMATQYSCLDNPMDRGAWRATGHGVAESDTPEHAHIQY